MDFLAPGAAVSLVPEWELISGRNMNGTSMAAPQASGALACLISAAKKEGLPTTWPFLAAALRRSARPVSRAAHVEQGYGLLDVSGALAALREAGEEPPVEWKVEHPGPNGPGRGWTVSHFTDQSRIQVSPAVLPRSRTKRQP